MPQRQNAITVRCILVIAALAASSRSVDAFQAVSLPFTGRKSCSGLVRGVCREWSNRERLFPPSIAILRSPTASGSASSLSMMMDFDGIRESLRGVIRTAALVGGTATVASLLQAAVTGKAKSAIFNAQALADWVATLSAEDWKKLAWCVALDIVGAAPELLLPGPLGDSLDLVWAPLYAYLLFQTFGGRSFLYKTTLAASGFLEEALPYTDVIPTATIGWLIEIGTDRTAGRIASTLEDFADGRGPTGKGVGKDKRS